VKQVVVILLTKVVATSATNKLVDSTQIPMRPERSLNEQISIARTLAGVNSMATTRGAMWHL
jgi:hypothetical protein